MYKGNKIVAIICARGGSVGVPNKNIKIISGKPLISWTIEAASKCEIIDSIIVSTDSKKIKDISIEYGAEVPVMRPKKLAGNKIGKLPALQHMLKWLENKNIYHDVIVDLDPTNPLRIPEDITKAVKKLIKFKKADSVISVFDSHHNPYWTMFEVKNNYLKISKRLIAI